jgi:hypothetical protein
MTDDAEASAPLTREQFRERFIAHFVWRLGPEMRGWADEMWESYWEDPDQRADGPEVCAAQELDEWHD